MMFAKQTNVAEKTTQCQIFFEITNVAVLTFRAMNASVLIFRKIIFAQVLSWDVTFI